MTTQSGWRTQKTAGPGCAIRPSPAKHCTRSCVKPAIALNMSWPTMLTMGTASPNHADHAKLMTSRGKSNAGPASAPHAAAVAAELAVRLHEEPEVHLGLLLQRNLHQGQVGAMHGPEAAVNTTGMVWTSATIGT